jgi:hypothetical protein
VSEFAKDVWVRIAPSWHFGMAGLAVGNLVAILRPGAGLWAGIATMLVFDAYKRMAYKDEY